MVCKTEERDFLHYGVTFAEPKTSNAPPEYCISSFKFLAAKKRHTKWCVSFLAE